MTPCDRCAGTLWVIGDDGIARRCVCFAEIVVRQRMKAAEIPAKHADSTLINFDTSVHQSAAVALGAARTFVLEPPRESCFRGLMLSGPPGTGKTHLAVAVLRELIEQRDMFGVFVSWNGLLERIRETFDDSERTSAAITSPLFVADVLVIDELGARRVTEWSHDTLTWLIGIRYDDNKSTVITTNYAGHDLTARIGIRLRSRIAEMCEPVEITGYDYRIRPERQAKR